MAAAVLVMAAEPAAAAISYTTMGGLYSENFNGLPTQDPLGGAIPTSGNLETDFPDGWQDDVDWTTSPEVDLSVLGWHLYHPKAPSSDNGFNSHQRFRMGTGNSGTGAFYGFALPNSGEAEKALGLVNSSSLTADGESAYMGLRLTNDSGQTLNRFTITYDGELWRRGEAATPQTLFFEYSLSAGVGSWQSASPGLFNAGTAADFVAPVALAGTTVSGVDGNVAGKVADITGTFTDLDWYPGQELWLRWRSVQVGDTDDDGLAIDNVRFTADDLGAGNPNNFQSIASGNAASGATWNDSGNPPAPGRNYRVIAGHAVTLDQDFAGDSLSVGSGGSLDIAASGLDVRRLVVMEGATLTESVGGSFQLGKLVDGGVPVDPLGVLVLQDDVDFAVNDGESFTIGLAVQGTGDMNIETGVGSAVQLADSQGHQGVIRFNGAGDEFLLGWNKDFRNVEMNSTGANKFTLMHQGERGKAVQGNLTFNEAGTIAHATTTTGPNSRLAVLGTLTANADVNIQLTDVYPIGGANSERRLQFFRGLEGNGDVHVTGMAFDPTDVNAGVLLPAFEIGSQSTEPVNMPTDGYSGTLSAVDFVSLKIRRNMPSARVEIGANARMDTGYNVQGSTKVVEIGELEVLSGGTLEVGYMNEMDGGSGGTGHLAGALSLVASGGRSGSLVLNSGSKIVVQVNGLGANQFDTIVAQGDITLGGTLEVWVNALSTTDTANPTFTPALNDEFVIMSLAAGTSPPADFDDSTVVDGGDLTVWEGAFGQTANGDADGDGDSDGADFLAWQRTLGDAGSTGTITGNFIDVVAPSETPWPAGLDFTTFVSGDNVVLKVISAPVATAVPEPSAVALGVAAALGLLAVRRKRTNT